jgi:hypothetical protein
MSKTMTRDPRQRPVANDVLMSGYGSVSRKVERVHNSKARGPIVTYTVTGSIGRDGRHQCDLASWHRWCRDRKAKIVKRA